MQTLGYGKGVKTRGCYFITNNSLRFNDRKISYLVFSSTHLRALTNASIHGVI
mgnify:CR=1 FL=1